MSNNIFVLCTGRCGSMTMAEACKHATNYSAAHESTALRRGLKYPDNHIEVNNRLTWFLGILDRQFPDARYVHLTRDPEAVALSHAKRCARKPAGIIDAWRVKIRMSWQVKHGAQERSLMTDCREYVDAVNSLIELFLRSPSRSGNLRDHCHVDINDPDTFVAFWKWAGCEGNIDEAVRTFRIAHNTGREKATKSKAARIARRRSVVPQAGVKITSRKRQKLQADAVRQQDRTTAVARAARAAKAARDEKIRHRRRKQLQRAAEQARRTQPRGRYGPLKRRV